MHIGFTVCIKIKRKRKYTKAVSLGAKEKHPSPDFLRRKITFSVLARSTFLYFYSFRLRILHIRFRRRRIARLLKFFQHVSPFIVDQTPNISLQRSRLFRRHRILCVSRIFPPLAENQRKTRL